jgi:hypothetical protein
VSIHADDEFNLRLALDSELDDVTPHAGLADLVIARYRKGPPAPLRRRGRPVRGRRRHRRAGRDREYVGRRPGRRRGRSGPVGLRLGSYTLTLPDPYHLSDARTAPCATGAGAGQEVAAVAPGVCVLMFFMPPAGPGRLGPDVSARRHGGHRRPLPGLARATRLRALR